MTTKRRTWKSKNRVTFWLENDLLGEIKSETKTRRISQQSIFEATLKDRYSVESREESEALIARRLNRIDNHIRAKQRLSEVHAEALEQITFLRSRKTGALADAADGVCRA